MIGNIHTNPVVVYVSEISFRRVKEEKGGKTRKRERRKKEKKGRKKKKGKEKKEKGKEEKEKGKGKKEKRRRRKSVLCHPQKQKTKKNILR